MRLTPFSPVAIRYLLGVASCAYALVGALSLTSLTGHAGQLRSVTEGVYSAAQAARGQQIYQAQCAECHGNALEGAIGTPLVGESFLSNWSVRSLADLVDKIQKTMPFNLSGNLSRQQSTDLAAYILLADKFPAGQVELSDAMLAQITFPTVVSPPAPPPATSAAGSLQIGRASCRERV